MSSENRLALLGGSKAFSNSMPLYRSFGNEEVEAVKKVVESGVLSKFIGEWSEDFYGGEKVRAFEKEWSNFFQIKHSISVNSNTSGLMCALGAIGLEPGDEVIISPWTMSADPASVLVWNAIPVFADIEPETFNLDPRSIEKKITAKTKAILVSDIFGQAADLQAIMNLAKKYKLKVIEDAAQAPGAKYGNRYVGTIADIGVFSFNYHKHIHTGEGGMCVTNDDELAERMQLIRNHAESVVAKKKPKNMSNMIGFNFRMGEMEAAIGLEQLKKLPALAESKTKAGTRLTEELKDLEGLQTPWVWPASTHVYYVYALKVDSEVLGVSRARIAEALRAEGIPGVMEGYKNLHLLPLFENRMAYGKSGFPWKRGTEESTVSYEKGICPQAERLHEKEMLGLTLCSYRWNEEDVDQCIKAFKKIWKYRRELV